MADMQGYLFINPDDHEEQRWVVYRDPRIHHPGAMAEYYISRGVPGGAAQPVGESGGKWLFRVDVVGYAPLILGAASEPDMRAWVSMLCAGSSPAAADPAGSEAASAAWDVSTPSSDAGADCNADAAGWRKKERSHSLSGPLKNLLGKDASITRAKTEWEKKRRENLTGGTSLSQATRRGWMKYRGLVNQWSLRYYVLVPPSLLYFKEEGDVEKENVLGIVYLRGCVVNERQSKKQGFCFKIEHPAHHNIYGSRGLKGEMLIVSSMIPGGTHECILRVPTRADGLEWVRAVRSAIEVANSSSPPGEFAGGDSARQSVDDGNDAGYARDRPMSPMARMSPSPGNGPKDPMSPFSDASQSGASLPVAPALSLDATVQPKSARPPAKAPSPGAQGPIVLPVTAARKKSTASDTPAPSASALEAPQQRTLPSPRQQAEAAAAAPTGQSTSTAAAAPPQQTQKQQQQQQQEVRLVPAPSRYIVETPRPEMKRDAFEEGKSILLGLMKQLRPGIDLSRVTLPTHILEPRSFLEKTTDYFAHIELLSQAVRQKDPMSRLLGITKWYMSGYYIMPKTPKKPYNPILGETFRCMWDHGSLPEDPTVRSRSYLVCEQVSHHPPVSAFFACNRADGWVINGSILFKSKFWGTSAGCLLNGYSTLYLPYVDEEYTFTLPSAVAKGFIVGPLTMELFDTVVIECKKTECCATLEFKTKPLLGGDYNHVSGTVTQGRATLYHISGRYDRELTLQPSAKGSEPESFWKVTPELAARRLPRHVIPFDEQDPFESERLWINVTRALIEGDQEAATDAKTAIERNQRESAKQRAELGVQWITKYFDHDHAVGQWTYKWLCTRPFNGAAEAGEYESSGRVYSIPRPGVSAPLLCDAPLAPAEDSSGSSSSVTVDDDDDDDDDEGMEDAFESEARAHVGRVAAAASATGAMSSDEEVVELRAALTRQKEVNTTLVSAVRRLERTQASLSDAVRLLSSTSKEPPVPRGSEKSSAMYLVLASLLLIFLAVHLSLRLSALEKGLHGH
eukprot:m51a1_g1698 putative C-tail anchored protein, PH and oxysterol-binding protein domain (1024) ;mRNA; f:483968-488325